MSLDSAPARGKRDGGACSVKTEAARIQELSLCGEGPRSLPKRKQRPPSGTLPTDLTTLAEELPPSDRKRGNKRALLISVPGSRHRDGEVVEAEGLLVVAEQVERGVTQQQTPVFQTLGSIFCVLVQKSEGLSLETVSQDSRHTFVLDLDAMDLVPFKSDRKFQLKYRSGGLGDNGNGMRASSYIFIASTKEEYVTWVSKILRCQVCPGNDRASAVGKDASGSSAGTRSSQVLEQDAARCGELQLQDQRQQSGERQQPQSSLGEFVYSTPPRTKHFILVRHGHYINAHVPQVADSQQVLSQMGRQQAELTGKHLGMAHNRVPTRHGVLIYHSDMTRAVETAALIGDNFGEVTLNPSRLLREGWPGTPYSTDFAVGGAAAARTNSAFDVMKERARVDVERMEKAFNWFFSDSTAAQQEDDEESYCVLVCHANLIRFLLCRALGIDAASAWGHFEINHCGVSRIDVCANRPIKIMAVNETGHLPPSLITSSEDHL